MPPPPEPSQPQYLGSLRGLGRHRREEKAGMAGAWCAEVIAVAAAGAGSATSAGTEAQRALGGPVSAMA